jgi:hypothetical protein
METTYNRENEIGQKNEPLTLEGIRQSLAILLGPEHLHDTANSFNPAKSTEPAGTVANQQNKPAENPRETHGEVAANPKQPAINPSQPASNPPSPRVSS